MSGVSNVSSSDDFYADVSALALGAVSNYILMNQFNFAIPSDANICGIELMLERSASGLFHSVHDESIQIIKGGAFLGTDKKIGATWPTSFDVTTYVGTSDLWGTTFTPADINGSTFGSAMSVNLSGISVLPTARMDYSAMNVYFSQSLPIGLFYFKTSRERDRVVVSWATSSEINNEEFEIEASEKAHNWTSTSVF
jgi:hypothetical protein